MQCFSEQYWRQTLSDKSICHVLEVYWWVSAWGSVVYVTCAHAAPTAASRCRCWALCHTLHDYCNITSDFLGHTHSRTHSCIYKRLCECVRITLSLNAFLQSCNTPSSGFCINTPASYPSVHFLLEEKTCVWSAETIKSADLQDIYRCIQHGFAFVNNHLMHKQNLKFICKGWEKMNQTQDLSRSMFGHGVDLAAMRAT